MWFLAPASVVWVGQLCGLDVLRSHVATEAQLLWLKMDGLWKIWFHGNGP